MLYDSTKCRADAHLALLGFPSALYQSIEVQSGELAVKMGEP